MRQEFGVDIRSQRADYLRNLEQNHWATLHDEVLILTDQGKLLADHITLELFQEAG
jgi:oxygen-independent coproporphyrinogen-3 oxidase